VSYEIGHTINQETVHQVTKRTIAWEQGAESPAEPEKGDVMRRAFSFLMSLILATSFVTGLQSPAAGMAQDAQVGAAILTDWYGAPAAEITVDSIADPFENYIREYSAPNEGYRFVLVTFTIENVGQAPQNFSTSSFQLLDRLGNIAYGTYIGFEDGVAPPLLTSDAIPPGERVTATVGFEMLAESEIAVILHQVDAERFVLLAAAPMPVVGDAVEYTSTDATLVATMTVNEFIDPLPDVDTIDYLHPARGYHFAAAVVTIQNTGDADFAVRPAEMSVIDEAGFMVGIAGIEPTRISYPLGETDVPYLIPGTIGPGESVTGMIVLAIFDGAEPAWIVNYAEGSFVTFMTFIAALPNAPTIPAISDIPASAPGAGSASHTARDEPTVAVDDGNAAVAAEAECTAAGEWIDRLFQRLEMMSESAISVEDPLELADVDTALLIETRDTLQQLRDEQAADPPPAVAADVQTMLLAVYDYAIEFYTAIIDAQENGEDVATVIESFQEQEEQVFAEFSAAGAALEETCPDLDM
jgi:hypothetical protein